MKNSFNYKNALIYDSEKRTFFKGGINAENGIITDFEEKQEAVDLCGRYVIPGLIDAHTHGRGGFDFNTATSEQIKQMKQLYRQMGVTTVIPTLASAPYEDLLRAIDFIKDAGYLGVHIEGRYLNPEKRGAHRLDLLAPLDKKEASEICKRAEPIAVHISAAYELDRDGSFLKAALEGGATCGLAHTSATVEEALDCVKRGVTSFTHLFNAMPPLHHRKPGAVGAGLISDAYTEIICDGFHLAPQTVKLVHKAKAADRIVLITDSMEGTGCPDGDYSIAGLKVVLKDGKAYTVEGAIAGSTLELFDGVKNYMKFCNTTFEDAVGKATVNPAKMIGIYSSVGSLEIGKKADICIVSGKNDDLRIDEVIG